MYGNCLIQEGVNKQYKMLINLGEISLKLQYILGEVWKTIKIKVLLWVAASKRLRK